MKTRGGVPDRISIRKSMWATEGPQEMPGPENLGCLAPLVSGLLESVSLAGDLRRA